MAAQPSSMNPIDKIRAIARTDGRYAPEAYAFIFEALDFTLKRIEMHRHVTGQELCEGIRDLAIERFGLLARTVFKHWGVTRTRDFGHIVFNLVESGLMGKTEDDRIEDFDHVYDFDEVFDRGLKFSVSLER